MSERQASTYRTRTFTWAQILLVRVLNEARIDCLAEYEIPTDLTNSRGQRIAYSIDIFIKPSLCVEVDGLAHHHGKALRHDIKRTEWLEAHGYRVIRFSNKRLKKEPYEIVREIRRELGQP